MIKPQQNVLEHWWGMKSHMTSNGFWKWKKVLKEVYCVTKNISLSVWLPAEASSLKKKPKEGKGAAYLGPVTLITIYSS